MTRTCGQQRPDPTLPRGARRAGLNRWLSLLKKENRAAPGALVGALADALPPRRAARRVTRRDAAAAAARLARRRTAALLLLRRGVRGRRAGGAPEAEQAAGWSARHRPRHDPAEDLTAPDVVALAPGPFYPQMRTLAVRERVWRTTSASGPASRLAALALLRTRPLTAFLPTPLSATRACSVWRSGADQE